MYILYYQATFNGKDINMVDLVVYNVDCNVLGYRESIKQTKQNKTKQNKTKQNKTQNKHCITYHIGRTYP